MKNKAIEAACKTLSEMWEEGNSLPTIMQAILLEYEAAKGDGWRPIEGAPKDGTYILVHQPETLEPDMTVCAWDADEEWWHCCDGKNPELPLRGNDPTHWRYLPTSPESEQDGE